MESQPVDQRPAPVENTSSRRAEPPVAIAGPSLLGLNPSSGMESAVGASVDSFRGMGSFYEQEEPHTGRRRFFLLLVLLVALAAAGLWTYKNYLRATSRQASTAASNVPVNNVPVNQVPPVTPPPQPAASSVPATSPVNGSSQPLTSLSATSAASPRQEPPSAPAVQASTTPSPASVAHNPAVEVKAARPKPTRAEKPPAALASRTTEEVADNGDAAYRKGEAYLYGRGVGEDCDQAVKYLKEASAKQNAKARSTFGTMYATGHCVARDLPASYGWFALALRVDPNNQILEKDLTSVWNQMTPPERQSATKFKP